MQGRTRKRLPPAIEQVCDLREFTEVLLPVLVQDFYDVLGVDRGADKKAIKTAYRQKARQYHPDVNKEDGAEEKFKRISNAYEVLSDDSKRGIYDRYAQRWNIFELVLMASMVWPRLWPLMLWFCAVLTAPGRAAMTWGMGLRAESCCYRLCDTERGVMQDAACSDDCGWAFCDLWAGRSLLHDRLLPGGLGGLCLLCRTLFWGPMQAMWMLVVCNPGTSLCCSGSFSCMP